MGQKIKQTEIKEVIRSVVRDNIKEVTTNDWHYKAIMSIWDKGGSFTRKKIGAVLCGDPKADRRDVEEAIRNSGYDEVTDVTDRLRIEGIITEGTANANILGIDFNISQTDYRIFFGFKDKKEASIKVRQIGSNKIVNVIQNGLDKAYGKGEFFFRSGSHSEIQNGYYFERKENSIDLNKLKFEGVIKEDEQIAGGLAQNKSIEDIAKMHGVSIDMLVGEFKKGIATEMEHTNSREVAKEITMDHLFEDPEYYTKLAKVEEYVDDKGVEHVAAALPQTEEEPIKEEESEETLRGLKEMAMGDLERIADYAKMILERMGSGQELDSWMYSQITLAVDQLNSVHDTMDGNDGVKESVNEGIDDTIKKLKSLISKQFTIIEFKAPAKRPLNSSEFLMIKVTNDKYGGPQSGLGKFIKKWTGVEASFIESAGAVKTYWVSLKQIENNIKESVNEDKVYIDYLNKQKGFKQDRIKFNSYEEAVKWAKKNFDKFDTDMIKYESVNEATEPEVITQIKTIAKNHQHDVVVDPKSGKKMKVDAFSASAIATVYDALSGSNQEKFIASGLLGMQQMAMKLLKR